MTYSVSVKQFFKLLFLLLLTNAVGYLGAGFMTERSMVWYHSLRGSALTPPDFVFGIVWPVLYALMALAAFNVWGKVSPRYFCLQLILNGLWSFIFFYFQAPFAALVCLVLMLYFLMMTQIQFMRASKLAGFLLVPVTVWCWFAFYLNGFIVFMN